MTTYISMLRGINVGGHKKIKMDVLKQLYVELGYINVQTYIQSGNIIFLTQDTDTAYLEKRISKQILKVTGFEVPVLVLKLDELKQIVENNPFTLDSTKNTASFHITFLSAIPDTTSVEKLKSTDYGADHFEQLDKVIYVYCPTGYGTTKLTNTFFENKLKVTATCRNWKTVNELVRLAGLIL
ncbi:MAG: DUF1697 domain-containing protein [Paludibacter sp.]|nr:DUF1697 domain-containing protein [Paludibacter sp.]